MYDLTTILTTISAASASIVAILGGLIASRLISLNIEREQVKNSINEIDKNIKFKRELVSVLQEENYQEDALFLSIQISNHY